jgi:hypothetical protein
MRALVRASVGVAFLARPLVALPLVAQQLAASSTSPGRRANCLDSIPPTALRRTPVYLASDVTPARLGGCVVPQTVSQPFTFELTR